MRKIENEIMVKQIETTWEASDGTIFSNELDCEKYEQSYKCTIINSFNKIPRKEINSNDIYCPYATYDDAITIIYPRHMDDIVIINAYVKMKTGDDGWLTQEHIGKHIMLNFGYDFGFCDIWVMEELLAIITARYKEQMAEIDTIANANKEKGES